MTIHLGSPSPATSCGSPGTIRRAAASLLSLAPGGVYQPPRLPGALVVSYTTVSPLPVLSGQEPSAVCSLWHFPSGHPAWVLPSTLPCGVRTFLKPRFYPTPAVTRRTRSSLVCYVTNPVPFQRFDLLSHPVSAGLCSSASGPPSGESTEDDSQQCRRQHLGNRDVGASGSGQHYQDCDYCQPRYGAVEALLQGDGPS